jgi:hypothetical protein
MLVAPQTHGMIQLPKRRVDGIGREEDDVLRPGQVAKSALALVDLGGQQPGAGIWSPWPGE